MDGYVRSPAEPKSSQNKHNSGIIIINVFEI